MGRTRIGVGRAWGLGVASLLVLILGPLLLLPTPREAMRALAEASRGGHGILRDPRAATRWEEAARGPGDQLYDVPIR